MQLAAKNETMEIKKSATENYYRRITVGEQALLPSRNA